MCGDYYNDFDNVQTTERETYTSDITCYDKILAFEPNDADVLCDKGLALYRLRKYEDALHCFNMALVVNPLSAKALYGKGMSMFCLNIDGMIDCYDSVMECLNAVLDVDPDNVNAMNSKGTVYYERGMYDRAVEFYKQALNRDPKNTTTLENLASMLCMSGKYTESVQYYDKLLALACDNISALKGKLFVYTMYSTLNDIGRANIPDERDADVHAVLKKTYTITIAKDIDGWLVGRCDELHVNSQGKTFGEIVENMREAVNLATEELGISTDFNMLVTER